MAVWLGPESDESETALRLMSSLYTQYHLDPHSPETMALLRQSSTIVETIPEALAVLALYNRTYWTRIWTVQEVFLANTVVVLCGDITIRWEPFIFPMIFFTSTAEIAYDYDFKEALLISSAAVTIRNRDRWRTKSYGASRRLENLLSVFCRKEASDRWDKVFALLALGSDREFCVQSNPILEADYSMSVIEVYANVLRKCLPERGLTSSSQVSDLFQFAALLQVSLDLTNNTQEVAEIIRLHGSKEKLSRSVHADRSRWLQYPGIGIGYRYDPDSLEMYNRAIAEHFESSDPATQSIHKTLQEEETDCSRLNQQIKRLKVAVYSSENKIQF